MAKKKNTIPVYTGGPSGGGTSSGGAAAGKSSGKSGGSGKAVNPDAPSAYEKRQNAKESSAKRKASDKYHKQADTLELQAKAIRESLSSKGFKEALQQRLANVDLVYKQNDAALMEGYTSRVGDLKGAQQDNERAESATSFANLNNRARERAMALGEAMSHGAGESDVLKSQMMSLQNWSANQGESNRSFFDSLRSINSSLGDLNADTKTARLNAESQMNNDKDQLYTQYFNQRSEAYTQLGNVQGQKAELYGLANEQISSKKSRKAQKTSTKKSGNAFGNAADLTSEAYTNPGNSRELREWQGEADFEGRQNSTLFSNAATNIAPAKKPEGATLRKW